MADINSIIPGEIWKAITDYPGYEVSNFGRVRSYWKWTSLGNQRKISPTISKQPVRIMKPVKYRRGYLGIRLCFNGVQKHVMIHRLVLIAFKGPCPSGCQSCHNDGNHLNNHISNLRWDTPKNNNADKLKHGTNLSGDCHPNSKLTSKQVANIRSLYVNGNSLTSIGKIYNTTPQNVFLIVNKINWKG